MSRMPSLNDTPIAIVKTTASNERPLLNTIPSKNQTNQTQLSTPTTQLMSGYLETSSLVSTPTTGPDGTIPEENSLSLIPACSATELKPETDYMSTVVSANAVVQSVSENDQTAQLDATMELKLEGQSKESLLIHDPAGNDVDSEIKSNQGATGISSKLSAFFLARSNLKISEPTSQFYLTLDNETSPEKADDFTLNSAPSETKSSSGSIEKVSKFRAFFSTQSKSKTEDSPSRKLASQENQTASQLAMPQTPFTELDPMNGGLLTPVMESSGPLNSEQAGAEYLFSAPEKPKPKLDNAESLIPSDALLANQVALELGGMPPTETPQLDSSLESMSDTQPKGSPSISDPVGNNGYSEIKSNPGSKGKPSKLNDFIVTRSKLKTGDTLDNETSPEKAEIISLNNAPPESKSNTGSIEKLSKFRAFFSTRSKSKTEEAPSQNFASPENQTAPQLSMPSTCCAELDSTNPGLETPVREFSGHLNSERVEAKSLISGPEMPQPKLDTAVSLIFIGTPSAKQSALEFDGIPPATCEKSVTRPRSELSETHAHNAASALELTSKSNGKPSPMSSLISALHKTVVTGSAVGWPSHIAAPMKHLGSLKFDETQPYIGAHPVAELEPRTDGNTLLNEASLEFKLQSEEPGSPVLISPPISPQPVFEPAETPSFNGHPNSECDETPFLLNAFLATQPKPKLAELPSCLEAPTVELTKRKHDETPLLIRAQLEAQQQLTRYKKTSGAADGSGENYEWKMLTLVFLRMLASCSKFELASNLEAAGLFDDIVVRYQMHSNHQWRVAYFQLKHKQNKNIRKSAFLGFSGDFSLVKYCASYASAISSSLKQDSVENQRFIIFTNASIDGNLIEEIESDPLFATGGSAVSFKEDGIISRELCEWVSFKEVLTELHGQIVDQGVKEVVNRVKDVLKRVKYQNKAVMSYREELMKSPTLDKLKDLLKKLELVSDRNTYSSFLANLHVYTNQSHETALDFRIKEELAKVWIRSETADSALLARELQDKVKSWWQKDSFFLTQDSWLWQGIIKSHTVALSKSTIDRLSESGAEFLGSSLKALNDRITEIGGNGGILNYRVESRTAASSLKVSQAFAKFGAWNMNVLYVNIKSLLDHEDNVLSTWETRWCRVLVVECDTKIDPKQAERISARILKLVNRKSEKKLLVLIATEKHELNVQLNHAESYLRFYDNFMWSDLTEKTREDILSINIVINGFQSPLTLAELMDEHQRFINNADLDVISQLLEEDFCCGKDLEEVGKYFVTRRLKYSTDEDPFVVNSLSDVSGRVVLVVAEPGMGKSTLIKHLAKSAKAEDVSAWIVHIQLNDCVQYLKVMDFEHFNETEAKKFLEHCVLTPGNSLEKLLFGSLDRKLVVFIDGVDEVCPHYEQEVFTLLSFLKGMEFRQLWVASRPVCQTKLEEILRVKTFHIVAFSEKDQKEFFNNVWMDKVPSATPMTCNELTEGLMSWLKSSLGEDNPILGIPLMTSMIAETFQEQMFIEHDISGEFRRNERLDILNLYKTFVGKKFDLYCVEKKKTQSRELAANKSDEENLRRRFRHNHRLAALRVLFSSKEIDSLKFKGKDNFEDDLTTYLKEVSEGREKVGIIDSVIDGNPHFVHRSFAEYFAASWLSRNFKTNREFMERISFDPAYKLVSDMFHRSLAEGHPLHVAVLNRDLKTMKSILSSQGKPSDVNGQDAGGRTLLHLAVLLSASDTHSDVINILEFLIIDQKARLDIADHVLNWVPLQYAEWSWAWTAMHIMLVNGENMKKTTRSFKGCPKASPFAMLNAAKSASLDVIRYLVKMRGGKLNFRGFLGDTMIHRAAEGGNIEMLKYLSKKGIPLDIKDNQKNTALFYASKQAVDYLIKKGVDMKAVNRYGLTAWQAAAQHGAYANMTALQEVASQQILSYNVPKVQRNASLLSASFSGNLRFVQKLVALGASVEHRDNNGHTPAWLAMEGGHYQVMDWLLLQGCLEYDTTLHAACRKSEPEIVSFILSRDVTEIGVKRWDGKQPFKKQLVTKLRVEKGPILNWRNMDGRTPLNEASFWGDEQIVALLLRHGADVNVADNKGQTPLMTATAGNNHALVKLLTEMGARKDSGSKNVSLSTLLLGSLNVFCSPHPQLFGQLASVLHNPPDP